MAATPVVTAVVPAYNAAKTIDETLHSVRAQTYRNLQIVVVDDGSTDGTPMVVEAHANADPRVILIRQANAGPAAGRNRAIAEARGEYIAPIDADDLWRPTKIEKQMSAMLSGGSRIGLVYTWQAIIDEEGRIRRCKYDSDAQGEVLSELLFRNFIGGGSPALMRKQAILDAGGYDGSVRGCEDWKLYLRIATRYEFLVIREHLTGYRQHPGSISRNYLSMLRSHELVCSMSLQSFPEHAERIEAGRVRYTAAMLVAAALAGDLRGAATIGMPLIATDPIIGLKALSRLPLMAARRTIDFFKLNVSEPFLPSPDHENPQAAESWNNDRSTSRQLHGNSLVSRLGWINRLRF